VNQEHVTAPPEHQPLSDARLSLLRAASALRAAVDVCPRLTQSAGDLHAQCVVIVERLRELEQLEVRQ
jgi:hypothetical protein